MQMVNGIGTTLYGHADLQPVPPEECVALEEQGFLPYSYRAVKWFVILMVPIVPLGCVRVRRTPASSWSPQAQYLLTPEPAHVRQIATHVAVGWGTLAAVVGGVMALL
jgi:hypothetical protein